MLAAVHSQQLARDDRISALVLNMPALRREPDSAGRPSEVLRLPIWNVDRDPGGCGCGLGRGLRGWSLGQSRRHRRGLWSESGLQHAEKDWQIRSPQMICSQLFSSVLFT